MFETVGGTTWVVVAGGTDGVVAVHTPAVVEGPSCGGYLDVQSFLVHFPPEQPPQ